MKRPWLMIAVVVLLGTSAGSAAAIDFNRDIRPILASKCLECHGPDESSREAGLRLDLREASLGAADSGAAAIVPKHPEQSELLRRVSSDDSSERMPPEGEPLSAQQIDLLREWIAAGAPWSNHWAFEPINRSEPPAVANPGWVRTPIDHFVLARLEAEGIAPSPEADRYTLIKRLYYDLWGLPPSLDEVEAFVQDDSPQAYEVLVERLLASPHFGERWGRHWLDKARYADSDGYEKDNPRPTAWWYRDWVIEAINCDLPYDQFTIEQLAGDLLPEATDSQQLATAFHRQTLTNREGGADQEEFRVAAVFDRVETTGSVWLGLTVGCARCHTHKYDPIAHREYYQLFAFFNNADEADLRVPASEATQRDYQKQLAQHETAERKLEAELAERRRALQEALPEWEETRQKDSHQPIAYHRVEVIEAQSEHEVQFETLPDGSLLATGANPAEDQYRLWIKTDLPEITSLRIEALADQRLPSHGPGRTSHGNFVLNEVRVYAGPTRELKPEHAVELKSATTDFAQQRWPAAGAIDGQDDTGWAISPQMGKDHHLDLMLAEPLHNEGNVWLQVVLQQSYGKQHTLGRYRVQAITGDAAALSPEIARLLETPAAQRTATQREQLLEHVAGQDAQYQSLQKKLQQLRSKKPQPPTVNLAVLRQRTSNPRTTHILSRGDFLQPGEPVQPGTLDVLPPLTAHHEGQMPDRLDLARWLVGQDNPLTPRVTVNQFWIHLFGRGLVATPGDFGVRGERPSHPELLDWLASELLRQGWSRKAMIRLIVNSATYRQQSHHRQELAQRDPLNTLLARQNRMRVEGELVRDIHLAISGLLSRKAGGPSVFPPLPADVAALSYANNFRWKTSSGEDRYRRGMYTFFKRTAPHPNLMTFDCPDANTTNILRDVSNTPLQALTTLNNETFVEAAQAFARRILTDSAANDEERLTRAYQLCAVRPPEPVALEAFQTLLDESRAWYADHSQHAQQLVGDYAVPDVSVAEAAAWVATARMMLNLDAVITRE